MVGDRPRGGRGPGRGGTTQGRGGGHCGGSGRSSHNPHVKKISHCPMELPNGKDATATRQGSVILDGGLRLDNVLFVPQLTCNLIYVTQLLDATNCIIQITNALCVIQDRTTRKLIGAGERADGIYFFRGVPKVCALEVAGDSSIDLWHKRLCHPSEKVLMFIPNLS